MLFGEDRFMHVTLEKQEKGLPRSSATGVARHAPRSTQERLSKS